MREMNMEEALDILSPMRNSRDGWASRHDDHYDHPPFPGQRFPPGPATQIPGFPPGGNAPNLLGNMSNAGSNSLINNISPNVVQKMLTQTGGSQGFGGSSAATGRSLQPPSQPSTQQLRMLVQQIQMAVQAGYLNHQVGATSFNNKHPYVTVEKRMVNNFICISRFSINPWHRKLWCSWISSYNRSKLCSS